MAKYKVNFKGYTIGANPSDWTTRWNSVNTNYFVQNVSGTFDGVAMHITGSSTASRRCITYNALNGVSNTDYDVLMKWRSSDTTPAKIQCRINGNVSGDATQANNRAYLLYYKTELTAGGNNGELSVTKYGSGGLFTVFTPTYTFPNYVAGSWYWLRMRKIQNNLYGRMWIDGTTEPTAWHVTATDTELTTGDIGIGMGDTSADTYPRDIDYFSVGTGTGVFAPMIPPTGTITNISKNKISDETGMSECIVTLTFDQPITTFIARLGGVDYNTGTIVDQQGGGASSGKTIADMAIIPVSTIATQTVGSQLTQPAIVAQPVTAIIDWNEGLSEGSNRINFYGQNADGEWSVYPS